MELIIKCQNSVHTPFLLGRRLNLLLNFQKGGGGELTRSQFLEGGCLELGGGELFQGGSTFYIKSFYIKNKLKSEIFNEKIYI